MSKVFLAILVFYVADVAAMKMSPEERKSAQYYWKQQSEGKLGKYNQHQEELRKQRREQQKDLLENIKNTVPYEKFDNQLQETVVAKGWFQGPSQQWKNQIIISAFDVLEPYSNRDTYGSQFTGSYDKRFYDRLHSHIKVRICTTIDNYDKKCYFHLYDPHVCSEIMNDVDGLLRYSVSGKKIESNFANKLLFGRVLEKQDYYDQLLQERSKKK